MRAACNEGRATLRAVHKRGKDDLEGDAHARVERPREWRVGEGKTT